MELKDAKCPNCGGQLKLNPDLERGMCIYCGTEIIVSDETEASDEGLHETGVLQLLLLSD